MFYIISQSRVLSYEVLVLFTHNRIWVARCMA